jgi:hypothetical protein
MKGRDEMLLTNIGITVNTKMATCFILGSILLLGSCPLRADEYTFVAIPENNCIQTNLISTFPVGYFVAANLLATPFNIPAAPGTCGFTSAGPCNFNDALGGNGLGKSLPIDVAIPHATHVFTLMNAYAPTAGAPIAIIQFFGSRGATQTFPLIAGQNIRDFYHGSFANTLSNGIPGAHAVNAFHCDDPNTCLGAGGTGNVTTGSPGLYVVDEQAFTLKPEFAVQTLVRITITDTHNGSTPILLGITALSK